MVLHSCELRWFLDGTAGWSDAVGGWHRAFGGGAEWQPADGAWRRDRYLLVPGVEDIGIKRREGRLEIKARREEPEIVRIGGAEGRLERWSKWSYAGAEIDALLERIALGTRPDDWVELMKRRLLVSVPLGGDRTFGIELALLHEPGREVGSWSLGIEAGPDEASLPWRLREVLVPALAAWPGPPLRLADSCGFPAWLRRRQTHMP